MNKSKKSGGEEMAEQQDKRTISELIADARARGVDPEKIAEIERWRAKTVAKFQATDRKNAAEQAVKSARAEAVRLADAATRAEEDLTAADARHRPAFENAMRPYRAVVTQFARERAEASERLTAAEAELTAAKAHEAQAFAERDTR